MTTYTINNGSDVIAAGLTLAEVGNCLIRRDGHEWHMRRDHDGPWTLFVRLNVDGQLSDWQPTKIKIDDADNEERANQAALEAVAREQTWAQGFRVTPEGEG